ncbi:apoptosis-stimulating of p53 protein 2-like [Rhopilema esculentum]|uniref:apoptosis-stimulating of p53 protein 2-like n=1 Tax=Rhopilema esculentum TaxID=499914 RepID=UPI0031E08272
MKQLDSMEGRAMTPTGKVNPLQTQMTLQQLQKMAEKQRQQILRNNQQLIEKQQRLKEMHSGKKMSQGSPKPNQNDKYAAKLRETYQNHISRLRMVKMAKDEIDSQKFNNIELAHELERVQEIFKAKQKELVFAAAKVDNLTQQLDGRRMGLSSARATPEKLNRRRKIRAAKEELDKLRKELSSRNEVNNEQELQLQLQRESLTEKRKELSELDKKIHLLGSQLHQKDASDCESDTSTSSELLNGDVNGNNRFGANQIFDTLQRKRINDGMLQRPEAQPYTNGKAAAVGATEPNVVPYTRRGKFYVAPDGREFDRPPTVEDYPQFLTGSLNNLVASPASSTLPVRSASSDSLPNLRGSSPHLPRARTDVFPMLQVNTSNGQLAGLPRSNSDVATTSLAAKHKFNVHSPSSSISSLSSVTSFDAETYKQQRNAIVSTEVAKPNESEIWNEKTDFRTSSPIMSGKMEAAAYKDAVLSACQDAWLGTASRYLDSPKTDCTESMTFQNKVSSKQVVPFLDGHNFETEEIDITKPAEDEKPPPLPRKSSKPPELPKKPPVAPKPALPPKKKTLIDQAENKPAESKPTESKPEESKPAENRQESNVESAEEFVRTFSHSKQPNMSELSDQLNKLSVHELVDQFRETIPAVKQPVVKQIGKDHYPGAGELKADVAKEAMRNTDAEGDETMMSDSSGLMQDSYEMQFADIDMISATQNDLLPYLNQVINEQPFDQSEDETSSQTSESERVIMPVIINVPPEKLPPTILKKPGRDNKKRGRIQLDPHALLLDAALEGEMKLVKEMVNRVPDPSFANAEGITALHNAVCGNHKDVVRFLVEIGCDINSPDNNGWTPLHCAAFYNDVDLCTFLVEHGASVFAMTYSDRQTAAEKCSRLEENYDQCFGYLHECKEQVGRVNSGQVCSLYDYTAEREDELSFHCGEQLTIVRRGDANEREWWWAENRKREFGYVPYNLLGIYPRIAGEV